MEIWKQIPGFPDYEVSDSGRVRRPEPHRNSWCEPNHVLAPSKKRNGYLQYALVSALGYTKYVGAHTLVLAAFVGPRPSEDHECAHFDGDKQNNRLTNLRWATRIENMADRDRHGTTYRGVKHHKCKLSPSQVLEIRALGESGRSQRAIAREFGISKPTVANIVHRRIWKHLTCQ